jgi:hypothetical protein
VLREAREVRPSSPAAPHRARQDDPSIDQLAKRFRQAGALARGQRLWLTSLGARRGNHVALSPRVNRGQ